MIIQNGAQKKVFCSSAAAHTDEIGNPPYPAAREKLRREGVPLVPHRARLLTREDGAKFDLLIGMDDANVRDIVRIVGAENSHKVKRLLDFTDRPRAIADPWYTGDFDEAYRDIEEGCRALMEALKAEIM